MTSYLMQGNENESPLLKRTALDAILGVTNWNTKERGTDSNLNRTLDRNFKPGTPRAELGDNLNTPPGSRKRYSLERSLSTEFNHNRSTEKKWVPLKSPGVGSRKIALKSPITKSVSLQEILALQEEQRSFKQELDELHKSNFSLDQILSNCAVKIETFNRKLLVVEYELKDFGRGGMIWNGEKDISEGYESHVTLPSSQAHKRISPESSYSDSDSIDQEENFAKIHGILDVEIELLSGTESTAGRDTCSSCDEYLTDTGTPSRSVSEEIVLRATSSPIFNTTDLHPSKGTSTSGESRTVSAGFSSKGSYVNRAEPITSRDCSNRYSSRSSAVESFDDVFETCRVSESDDSLSEYKRLERLSQTDSDYMRKSPTHAPAKPERKSSGGNRRSSSDNTRRSAESFDKLARELSEQTRDFADNTIVIEDMSVRKSTPVIPEEDEEAMMMRELMGIISTEVNPPKPVCTGFGGTAERTVLYPSQVTSITGAVAVEREKEPYRGVALPLEDSVYPVKETVKEKRVVGAGVGKSPVGDCSEIEKDWIEDVLSEYDRQYSSPETPNPTSPDSSASASDPLASDPSTLTKIKDPEDNSTISTNLDFQMVSSDPVNKNKLFNDSADSGIASGTAESDGLITDTVDSEGNYGGSRDLIRISIDRGSRGSSEHIRKEEGDDVLGSTEKLHAEDPCLEDSPSPASPSPSPSPSTTNPMITTGEDGSKEPATASTLHFYQEPKYQDRMEKEGLEVDRLLAELDITADDVEECNTKRRSMTPSVNIETGVEEGAPELRQHKNDNLADSQNPSISEDSGPMDLYKNISLAEEIKKLKEDERPFPRRAARGFFARLCACWHH